MVFNKYADFKGRATRPEFWWFFLFYIVVYLVLLMLSMAASFFAIVLTLFLLAILIPYLAVSVRRLHDVGKSGWFVFVSLIPLIGTIWLIVLLASEGQSGANEYGPDPRNPVASFDFDQPNYQV